MLGLKLRLNHKTSKATEALKPETPPHVRAGGGGGGREGSSENRTDQGGSIGNRFKQGSVGSNYGSRRPETL